MKGRPATALCGFIAALGVCGCAGSPSASDASVVEVITGPVIDTDGGRKRPMRRVRIDDTAIIHLDGRPVSLDQLETALLALSNAGGIVRYTRDEPATEPSPEVADTVDAVMQAIVAARVTVELVEGGFDAAP